MTVTRWLRLLSGDQIEDVPEAVLPECKDPVVEVGPLDYIFIVILSMMSGAFSGLNLGLLGLDVKNLELLTKGPFNDEQEVKDAEYAKKILPLRRRGNLLLCTILLGNVTVNSGLSILMGDLTSGLMGLIISTAIITLFGEIIPQAACSRYALIVGAHSTWFIYIFMFITFPIAFPIAAILDKILGEEVGNVLSKSQMKRMFEMLEVENVINTQEKRIVQAALSLQEKNAEQVMTPIDQVYMLDINTELNHKTLRDIYSQGFSRIPIYDRNKDNIVGVLMTRDLILINPDKALITLKQLSSIVIRDVVAIDCNDKLEPLMGFFKRGTTHIGVVTKIKEEDKSHVRDPVRINIGIVTLEDIIEEIIAEEIDDEFKAESKHEKKQQKDRLMTLFMDHEAENVLSAQEIKACLEFLQQYVKPFQMQRMKRDILHVLIRRSTVVELHSDEHGFSHNIDQQDELNPANKYKKVNPDQQYYEMIKKKENQEEGKSPNKMSSAQDPQNSATKKPDEEYAPQLLNQKTVNHDTIEVEGLNRSDLEIAVPIENNNIQDTRSIKAQNKGSVNQRKTNQMSVIVPSSMVKNLSKHEDLLDNEDMDRMINPILFVRGVASDSFYLILQGKVRICSGNEGFMLDQGPFNYMGVECLTNDNYVPDFSAKIIGKAKLLKISRADYRNSLSHVKNS